jgi:hypothetical protein
VERAAIALAIAASPVVVHEARAAVLDAITAAVDQVRAPAAAVAHRAWVVSAAAAVAVAALVAAVEAVVVVEAAVAAAAVVAAVVAEGGNES